jgi:hypothetical protein
MVGVYHVIRWLRRPRDAQGPVNPDEAINRIRNVSEAIRRIRAAIDAAPRNSYIAELHLQIIKYADELNHLTGKEFCETLGIGPAYGTEFLKMLKISERLRSAGLDPSKI